MVTARRKCDAHVVSGRSLLRGTLLMTVRSRPRGTLLMSGRLLPRGTLLVLVLAGVAGCLVMWSVAAPGRAAAASISASNSVPASTSTSISISNSASTSISTSNSASGSASASVSASASGSASSSAACRSYPRPATTVTGPTPANLRAEYAVLGGADRPSDRIALRRLGSLPESGILVAGIRYLGAAAYGGRAYLVPARHLLASALAPASCVPASQRALQRALLPSLRAEYAHEALCLVIVYPLQASPSCQPAPGTVAALLYGPGSPGFGLAPDGVPSVTLRFRGHGPIRAGVRHNFWIVNDESLLLSPCGLDWTTANGTVLRTVASCTKDTT